MKDYVVKKINQWLRNFTPAGKEFLLPWLKNFTATGKEFLPNNTNNNIIYTATAKEKKINKQKKYLIKIN